MKEEVIALKRAEIKRYRGVLERYVDGGRWYNSGRRHLDSLVEELRVLEIGPMAE